MKWTFDEEMAIRATMEHWKDDVIPYLKGENNDYGECPLCLLCAKCEDCPVKKFYKVTCSWIDAYKNFTSDETIENAIHVYNAVADMIGEEHYKE